MATTGIRGEINLAYDKSGAHSAITDARRVSAEFERLTQVTRNARQGLGKGNGGAGMAMLEFSRAVEDAQYGMRGVLNNIPQLVMLMGGSAGLAGAVSMAAVAGAQLGEKLRDLWPTATKTAEETRKMEQAVREWADTLLTREKEAINGSIEGRERLASATQAAAHACAYFTANIEKNATVERAIAEARQRVNRSRITGNSPEAEAKRGAMEIEAEVSKADAELGVIQKKMDVNVARMHAAAEAAEAAEALAREAWTNYEIDKNTTLISEETKAMNKIRAMQADADAKAAREAATKIANEVTAAEIELVGKKEAITKTSNDRIEAMARELQEKLAGMARQSAQEAIANAKAQDEKYMKWKETVDETVAKEKEREAKMEEARRNERRQSAAQIAINQARRDGDEKEVERLERKRRLLERIEQLLAKGFSREEAARMAAAEEASTVDEQGRRQGRNGRMRIGRPGRGKIGMGGIDGDGQEWAIDRYKRYRVSSLRGEMDAEIGRPGEDKPKVRVREKQGGGDKMDRLTEANVAMRADINRMAKDLSTIAAKMRNEPLTKTGERNYVALP